MTKPPEVNPIISGGLGMEHATHTSGEGVYESGKTADMNGDVQGRVALRGSNTGFKVLYSIGGSRCPLKQTGSPQEPAGESLSVCSRNIVKSTAGCTRLSIVRTAQIHNPFPPVYTIVPNNRKIRDRSFCQETLRPHIFLIVGTVYTCCLQTPRRARSGWRGTCRDL